MKKNKLFIEKALSSEKKKIQDLMNDVFFKKFKNLRFVHWQYFAANFKTKLIIAKKENQIISMGGHLERKLNSNKRVYQLIGLKTLKEFRKTGIFTKIFNNLLKKKNIICFGNSNIKNYFLKRNFKKKKILNLISTKINFKKKFSKINNSLILYKSNNFFRLNKNYFFKRYSLHPMNRYFILKNKKYNLVYKIFKIKNKKYLDIIDIYIKKKSNLFEIFYDLNKKILNKNFNYINLFVYEKSLLKKKLCRLNFYYKNINNKYLFYKNINNKTLEKALVMLGHADY
jgi:hypothetical protein